MQQNVTDRRFSTKEAKHIAHKFLTKLATIRLGSPLRMLDLSSFNFGSHQNAYPKLLPPCRPTSRWMALCWHFVATLHLRGDRPWYSCLWDPGASLLPLITTADFTSILCPNHRCVNVSERTQTFVSNTELNRIRVCFFGSSPTSKIQHRNFSIQSEDSTRESYSNPQSDQTSLVQPLLLTMCVGKEDSFSDNTS